MVQRISISIPDEMYDWITKNRFSPSKIFQEAVDTTMSTTDTKKKNPLLFVTCTGLTIMGVVLILTSFIYVLSWEIRIFLPILGGILSFTASYSYIREIKRYRK